MNRSFINAFTLVELIVAMVFSSIIVTFAYSLYINTNRTFLRAFDDFNKTRDLLMLQAVLNQDCNRAHYIIFNEKQITVENEYNERIRYILSEDFITRSSIMSTDSFHLGEYKDTVIFLFDKPPVVEEFRVDIISKDSMIFRIAARATYTSRMKVEYLSGLKNDHILYGY
jgi:prepilin-type N-terminal cleavage/methylation domain-containing protein